MWIYLLVFIITAIFAVLTRENYVKYRAAKRCYNSINNSVICTSTDMGVRRQKLKRNVKNKYYNYIFLLILTIIPLLLLTGLRREVGTDVMYTYVPNFYRARMGVPVDYNEFGFNLLLKLVAFFFASPTALLFVTGGIYLTLILLVSIKYSDNTLISIAILLLGCFYFLSLNNIRQSIATIIMVYAIRYMIKRRHIPFFISLLIAVSFHYSAILMMIPYIFVNLRFVRKHFLLIVILSVALLPVFSLLFRYVVSLTHYNYFLVSDYNNNRPNIINVLYNVIFFLTAFIVIYDKKKMNRIGFVLLSLQFFAMFFSLLSYFVPIGELLARVTTYFTIFQILLIPYVFKKIKLIDNKIAYLILCISMYAIYMGYYIIIQGYYDVIPYVSVIGNPFVN